MTDTIDIEDTAAAGSTTHFVPDEATPTEQVSLTVDELVDDFHFKVTAMTSALILNNVPRYTILGVLSDMVVDFSTMTSLRR